MTCLIGNLMNGITVLQRIRTEIVPQRLRGNHIRILIKYLVNPRRTQFPVLTADKQIWAVRVPHLQVFPDGIDNLIIEIDQSVLVALADDPKLLGRQVNLAQLQIDALTAPDPGISIKRDNAKIPLASAFQKTLAERLHILFLHCTGAGILDLDFHEITVQYRSFRLPAARNQILIQASQGRQVVVYGLWMISTHIAHIRNVFLNIGPVQQFRLILKAVLAPDQKQFCIPQICCRCIL